MNYMHDNTIMSIKLIHTSRQLKQWFTHNTQSIIVLDND